MNHDNATTTSDVHPRGWASIGELDQEHAPTSTNGAEWVPSVPPAGHDEGRTIEAPKRSEWNGARAASQVQAIPTKLRKYLDTITIEADRVTKQWEGLGRIGAQREDHGAALVQHMLPVMIATRNTLNRMLDQLGEVHQHPFGKPINE